MSEFDYNLLTINGITKICDDNMYLQDGDVINYQWLYFQLEYLLKKIGIMNRDNITGLKLTKAQICKIIKDYQKSNSFTFDKETDSKFGFIHNKVIDNISHDNLGGVPDKNLKTNKEGTKLNNKPNKYLFGQEALDYSKQHKNNKDVIKKRKFKTFKKKITMENKWAEPNLNRKNKALAKIPQWIGDHSFLNYGRLDWNNNSCWADSVLVMILFKIYKNSNAEDIIHPLFKKNIIDKIPSKEEIEQSGLQSSYNCFKPEDFERSYPIIKNIHDSFGEIFTKLNNKEIFRVNKLLYDINQCPSKKGTENWVNGRYHDALDFFKVVFQICNIPSEEYNIKQTLKLFKRDITYTASFDSMFSNDFVTNDETDGEIISLPIEQNNVTSEVITKDIMPDDLKNLKSLTEDGGLISYFLDNKFEQNVELYDTADGVNIFSENNRRYLEFKDEKQDITDGYNGPLATYIPKIVQRFIINDTNHIFFGIHRLNLNDNGKQGEQFNNIKITPDQIINLSGPGNKRLILRSIIVWYNYHYVTFFQKNNLWYLYNDYYDANVDDDYVKIIGSYNNLISYNLTSNVSVLTNSVLLWYSI